MSILSLHRKSMQQYCVSVLLVFSLYLVGSVTLRSKERKSIFSSASALQDSFAGLAAPLGGGSKLQLRDFRRVAVKDGKPVWEVEASEAEYYSREGVTHLNNASLVIHRENAERQKNGGGTTIGLTSKAAKLYMEGDGLRRAELVGDSEVVFDSDLRIKSTLALYDVKNGEVTSPAEVDIRGPGYSITGQGLRAQFDSQIIQINRNVSCVFETSARIPDRKVLPLGKGGG